MNFVDIIEKFNINKVDNYYEITNKEYHFNINRVNNYYQITNEKYHFIIIPSYVYQDLIVVAMYEEDVNTVNIIHIKDLEKLILAFIEKKYIKLQEYFDKQNYLNNRKYYLISGNEFLHSFINICPLIISIDNIVTSIDIFNNEFIILEKDNNFYKIPNTDIYIYCQFQYLFDSKNWDITFMYQNLDEYLNYDLDLDLDIELDLIGSDVDDYIPILEELKDIEFLEMRINFNRKQFNNITARLKNETIFDILNINQFRRK